MNISKSDLIRRLVAVTGKEESEFSTKTVADLSALYECCISDEKRIYIEVPYKDKGLVKLLGARYDGAKKQWYIPQGADEKLFDRWM